MFMLMHTQGNTMTTRTQVERTAGLEAAMRGHHATAARHAATADLLDAIALWSTAGLDTACPNTSIAADEAVSLTAAASALTMLNGTARCLAAQS